MDIHDKLYDVIVVGAGPAGLSAAIYASRAKYRVLVLEKGNIGGQITITSEIVNYPGVALSSGKELTQEMRIQAEKFGAAFESAEVLEMDLNKDVKVLHTTKGDYEALSVILAPGANPRQLGFPGEKKFQGRGVAYCATCDGEFFTGKEVFVIGGGFAAVEESMFLTKYASKVHMIVREEDFTCAKTISDHLKEYDKIDVVFETEVVEVAGDTLMNYARFRDNKNKKEWEFKAAENDTFGLFVFAGYVPNTKWITQDVEKDKQGYIITDSNKKTNLQAVYAAGDVCVKNLRQVVTAVADGAIAATSAEKDVAELHKKLDLPDMYEGPKTSASMEHVKKVTKEASDGEKNAEGFISAEIKEQLLTIFEKFADKVNIKLWADESDLSSELKGFLGELCAITDKVSWQEATGEKPYSDFLYPAMELCKSDGSSSSIFYHGVPGGHEFNSFILALYNVAGPGQAIEENVLSQINSLDKKLHIKVLVSLSCTMCPEVVVSSQRIASLNKNVTAEMYDISHYPDLKAKYNVMSVPCAIINDDKVTFGKKNIEQLLELLKQI